MEGIGLYVEDDQTRYLGEFKNNKKDGYGIYKYSALGLIYEGYWKKNKWHGLGVVGQDKNVI